MGALAFAGIAAAFLFLSGTSEAAETKKNDFTAAHSFKIEIDGVLQQDIGGISGLESEVEIIEYKNGDDPVARKRPGRVKYGNIVLERGLSNDKTLHEWFKKSLAGSAERKSGSVIYLDRAGNEVLRYNFFEAWPCSWKAPELNAQSKSDAVEEIELCVEKIERI